MGDQQRADKPSEAKEATLKIKLKVDSGFESESTHRISVDQWADINIVLEGESVARSAVVASVTEEGFTQQIHFMQRQSQMLAEQGDDVASRVMAEAAQMVADVWKDRERYRQGMANWKATAEAKDREFARSAIALTDEEIIAAWNGAGPTRPDGPEMYLHYMRAVAKAQLDKATHSPADRNVNP